MASDLELLLKLQVIDYDIGELERSKEYLPDMIENLNREINESKKKLEETRNLINDTKVKQKDLEMEIGVRDAELQKYQQQMMSIKTNKEYDALVAQIDSIKEIISQKETELLETIERVGNLEKEIKELEVKTNDILDNNTKQLSILHEKVNSIGNTMSEKTNERNGIVSNIPRPILAVYERVRRGKGGQAVVVVKKRACGACFKALTPHKVQEVKRADKIYNCDSCGAIIYWDEEVSN
ncbi:MAG: C4-type zinc ribbon domain-containing protein [candidate division Zixibacteria bacterium]|nr:C4-type zinc ribbon domain-containing protein [candidate division Zixibacteria bacterium]MDD5425960.1 C4-type zinc ribbon domain-containing protein [candidate division Zixibacteria bacterium]